MLLHVTKLITIEFAGLRDKTEERSQKFVDTMVKRYPDDLSDFSTDNLDDLYAHLYTADCRWTPRVDVMYMPGDNITLINGTFQPDVGAGNASRLRASTHVCTRYYI
ncbi:hypothetical protein DPMN_021520 [Dreissena polymorpha]|uniref:Uncharacterized protein n=1 Tax=Dreissena polymorpha TaxID=45954 RepID=A0A9D4SBU1_DREPO|nr:hypothetical protein DPMN_021520 [Dreissena polymorpha]